MGEADTEIIVPETFTAKVNGALRDWQQTDDPKGNYNAGTKMWNLLKQPYTKDWGIAVEVEVEPDEQVGQYADVSKTDDGWVIKSKPKTLFQRSQYPHFTVDVIPERREVDIVGLGTEAAGGKATLPVEKVRSIKFFRV